MKKSRPGTSHPLSPPDLIKPFSDIPVLSQTRLTCNGERNTRLRNTSPYNVLGATKKKNAVLENGASHNHGTQPYLSRIEPSVSFWRHKTPYGCARLKLPRAFFTPFKKAKTFRSLKFIEELFTWVFFSFRRMVI